MVVWASFWQGVLDGALVPVIHPRVGPSPLNLRLKPQWISEALVLLFFDFEIWGIFVFWSSCM